MLYGLPPTLLGEFAGWLGRGTGCQWRRWPPARCLRLKAGRSTQTRAAWAARHAATSTSIDLMCVYYERQFQRPLADLRKELRIIPCPAVSEVRIR